MPKFFSAAQLRELEAHFVKRRHESYIRCGVHNTTTQTITKNTWTAITFNTEDFDTDSIFTVASPSRFTIRTAGFYVWHLGAVYSSNQTGSFREFITHVNGAPFVSGISIALGTNTPDLSIGFGWQFTVGDYLEFYTFHNANVNLTIGVDHDTRASIVRVQ